MGMSIDERKWRMQRRSSWRRLSSRWRSWMCLGGSEEFVHLEELEALKELEELRGGEEGGSTVEETARTLNCIGR
jgi:hypothetical protein